MDRAAILATQLSTITGATIDPATNQVVLLGEQQAGIPSLRLDDFVAAMRAVYGSVEAPGVSIDPPSSGNASDPQEVTIFAGLEDTHLGYVFYEADRVMKSLAAGRDNIADQPVQSSVPGYKSMAQRWADSYDPNNPNQIRDAKWFFKIADMDLVRSPDRKSFVFEKSALRLEAVDPVTGEPSQDPDAQAFALWFTENYDAIAAEAYAYPSSDGDPYSLVRLKQAAQAVSFAQFLRDNDIDIDFSWINNYQLEFVDTPETTPTVTVDIPTGDGNVVRFTGGVDVSEPNSYLVDIHGVARAAAADAGSTRESEIDQNWMLSDGSTQAVAVSLAATRLQGNVAFAETDLVLPTVGKHPLAAQRFYNAAQPVDGPFGFGWNAATRELQFERPAFVNSTATLDGLREGEVRFVDRVTGQVLTFISSLDVERLGGGDFSVGGLVDGLPVFWPSAERDGSLLSISADRTSYTLTRPDGARYEFDAQGRLQLLEDRHGNALSYSYVDGRLATITDEAGHSLAYTYNAGGRISSIQASNGEQFDFAYDVDGNLLSSTRARGAITTRYAYDAEHRMVSAIGPDGFDRLADTSSDVWNRSTARTDGRGNLAELDYGVDPTSSARVATVEDVASGLTSTTRFDDFNRPELVADGIGRAFQFGYESTSGNRNPTSIRLPDASRAEVEFRYNTSGQLISVYDPENDPDGNGYTQRFYYDSDQNLIRHLDAREIETTFAYDDNNNMIRVERAGATWTYSYYANGLLETATDPLLRATTYVYDSAGNLTRLRDALNGETVYTYDALNRLETVTDAELRTIHYTYNDRDQITRIDTPVGHVLRNYDPTTLRLIESIDFKGVATTYSYDPANGDLLRTMVDGTAVDYGYNRFGAASFLQDDGGTRTEFLYDDLGRPAVTFTVLDDVVEGLRDAEQPWEIRQGTLVVAGSDTITQADSILLDVDGTTLNLTINMQSFMLSMSDIDAIYIDAGDGDDLIDLRAAPPEITVTVLGQAGSDVILAGPGNDLLLGGDGADWIEGGGGNDWIYGGKDADVLFGHVSAALSIHVDADVTQDHLSGGDGDDLLYSRQRDRVIGGGGDNSYFGEQLDGSYVTWTADDVPLGLTGRLLLIGDEGANEIVIKEYGDKLLLTIDDHTRVVDKLAFDFVTGLFRSLLVLPAGSNDVVDLADSPVPVFFFGGQGSDTVTGSPQDDALLGGGGDDLIMGGDGNDWLLDGTGIDELRGDGGNNRMYSTNDGAPDVLRGASARSMSVRGDTSDTVQDAREDDVIVEPGIPIPDWFPVEESDWQTIRRERAQTVSTTRQSDSPSSRRSDSTSQRRRPATPVRNYAKSDPITNFSMNARIYVQGDYADARILTGLDNWARITVQGDLDNNGQFETKLATSRIGTGDWRVNLNTAGFPVGDMALRAVIETYEGGYYETNSWGIEILAAPEPDALPPRLDVSSDGILALVPHRNGDINLPGHRLDGAGEIDLWEITPMTGGGFDATATGGQTIVAWYDATGERFTFPDDDGQITVTLEADHTYYFAVTTKSAQGTDYDLVLTGRTQETKAAIDVPPAAYEGSETGSFDGAHRLEYYSVIAPQPVEYVSVTVDADPELSLWVRIADEANNTIGIGQTNAAGWDDQLTLKPVAGMRKYYVTLYSLDDSVGNYDVTVNFGPDAVGLPDILDLYPEPPYEPLIPLSDGDYSLSGQAISSAGELDYYRFIPTYSGNFTLETSGGLDTQLGVYRQGGTAADKLREAEGGGAGRNARLAMDFTAGQYYWIVVRAAGTETGAYGLHMIGPDQPTGSIGIAGFEHRGEDTVSLNGSQRQHSFFVVAPPNTTTLDVSLENISTAPDRQVESRFFIEDSAGNVRVVNDSDVPGHTESITNYPVNGGEKYFITAYGNWLDKVSSLRLKLDFDPNGSAGAEKQVNSFINGDQRYADVAMNASGATVFTWVGAGWNSTQYDHEDNDVFFQRTDAQGNFVGGEGRANNADGAVNQRNAVVGVAGDGSFAIAWIAPPSEYGWSGPIMMRLYDANANPRNQAGEVSSGLQGSNLDIAVSNNGSFMVVAVDNQLVTGRLFNAAGQPLTDVFAIDATADDSYSAAVAVDGGGNYIVTWDGWSQDNSKNSAYAIRFDASGNPIPPAGADLATDEVTGVWFEDVNGNGTQDSGENGLANATLSLTNLSGGGVPSDVTTDAAGNYTFTGVTPGIYTVSAHNGVGGPARLMDDFDRGDGTDLGNSWTEVLGDLVLASGVVKPARTGQESTAVFDGFSSSDQRVEFDVRRVGDRYASGGVLLGYGDTSHFLSVRFDSEYNSPNFHQLRLSTATAASDAWPRQLGDDDVYADVPDFSAARVVAALNTTKRTVSVGIDTNFDGVYETVVHRGGVPVDRLGGQVALYLYENAQIDNFTIDGKLAAMASPDVHPGFEFEVGPGHGDYKQQVAIDANASGQFVIAYNTSPSVYAQRFDDSAQLLGPPLQLNAHAGSAEVPDVAMKDNGEFVSIWHGKPTVSLGDGSEWGVYARQFDATGIPITLTDQLINITTQNAQWWSAISSDGGMNFATAWHGYNPAVFYDDIYARFIQYPDAVPRPLLSISETSGTANDNRIEFGDVVHQSTPPSETITITNLGTAALTGTLALSGATAFTHDGGTSIDLAPGQSLDVVVTLATTLRGSFSGALTLTHNAATDPAMIQLSGVVRPVADAWEANNGQAQAGDLGIVDTRNLAELSIHEPADEDWFKFSLEESGDARIRLAFAHSEGDLDFVALDDAGEIRGFGGSRDDNESAVIRAVGGEWIYVHVFGNGSAANVYNLEVSRLALGLSVNASSIVENAGAAAARGTVSRQSDDLTAPLPVNLHSGDASEIGLPAQVVIPAGETSVSFDIDAIDDRLLDGTVSVELRATAVGFAEGRTTIDVLDQDQVELQPLASGVLLKFAATPDLQRINLFDGVDAAAAPADFTLVGQTVGPVVGSLAWDAGLNAFWFVKTGGPLVPDTYIATVFSRADGFTDANGNLLDGDGDGTAGGDFQEEFVVAAADAISVVFPDFARGAGQAVDVPGGTTGLPLRVTETEALLSLALDVVYDPALLTVTGADLASGLPADWNATFEVVSPGLARLAVAGSTPLAGTDLELLRLTANVPDNAAYGASQAIRIANLIANNGATAAIGDVALHKAAYFGDVDGNRAHTFNDLVLLSRLSVLLDNGFDAHDWTDPRIIGDVDGNGLTTFHDMVLVSRASVLLPVPQIPAIPSGVSPPDAAGGIDPQFVIADDIPATAGSTVTVPVELDVESGAVVQGATFDITYDPDKLAIAANGDLVQSTTGWSNGNGFSFFIANVVTPGQARVTLFNPSGQSPEGVNHLLDVIFRVDADALGATPVTATAVDPNDAGLVWTTEPGSVLISAPDTDPPGLVSFTRGIPAASPTNADAVVFTVTFDEDVAEVDITDFRVLGTTTASVTEVTALSASVYQVTVAGGNLDVFNGEVGLDLAASQNITDTSGNALPAGEPGVDETYVIDNVAPAVSFFRETPAGSPTNADRLIFRVRFDEPVVNVAAQHFRIDGTSTAVVTDVTAGADNSFLITVENGDLASFNGVVGLNLGENQPITDLAGNALPQAEPTVDETYLLDNTTPALASIARQQPASHPTNADVLVFRVMFSEDVVAVDTTDFKIHGTSSADVAEVTAISGLIFDVTVSGGDLASFNGEVGLDLSPSQNVADAAGNRLPADEPATDETYVLDNTAPVLVSFTRDTPAGSPTSDDTLIFLASFNEAVTGVDTGDFVVNGTTTAVVTDVAARSTSTYAVTVSGGDLANFNGSVGLDLAAGQNITDVAGNPLPAGEPAVDESYDVQNAAEPLIAVRLVPVAAPTPRRLGDLPDGIEQVSTFAHYYLELWLQDLSGLHGVNSGALDVRFDTSLVDGVAITHDFTDLASGTIFEAQGLVDDVGGGILQETPGKAPEWARMAVVEVAATDVGDSIYSLEPGYLQLARASAGKVAWNAVDLGAPVSVEHLPGGDISVRIVRQPTVTEANGEVAALPANAAWLHEWEPFYVEIYVQADAGVGALSAAQLAINYPTAIATAKQVDFHPSFTAQGTPTIDDAAGTVTGIHGVTTANDLGDDRPVLLARVFFEPTSSDQVEVDVDNRSIGPAALAIAPSAAGISVGQSASTAADTHAASLEMWAIPYDFDDNDIIDFGDFAIFTPVFAQAVDAGNPVHWWADFDKDLTLIDFGDFSYFAPNFAQSKPSGAVTLPANFPEAWRPPANGPASAAWDSASDGAAGDAAGSGPLTPAGFAAEPEASVVLDTHSSSPAALSIDVRLDAEGAARRRSQRGVVVEVAASGQSAGNSTALVETQLSGSTFSPADSDNSRLDVVSDHEVALFSAPAISPNFQVDRDPPSDSPARRSRSLSTTETATDEYFGHVGDGLETLPDGLPGDSPL